jgi:hypothetical protein
MFILSRSNVDGHIPVLEKFESKPSYDEIYDFLFQYFSHEESEEAAKSLIDNGYASMQNYSATEYELTEVK